MDDVFNDFRAFAKGLLAVNCVAALTVCFSKTLDCAFASPTAFRYCYCYLFKTVGRVLPFEFFKRVISEPSIVLRSLEWTLCFSIAGYVAIIKWIVESLTASALFNFFLQYVVVPVAAVIWWGVLQVAKRIVTVSQWSIKILVAYATYLVTTNLRWLLYEKTIANMKGLLDEMEMEAEGPYEGDCPICMEALPTISIRLSCGHTYCRQCLAQYINNSVVKLVTPARCPHPKCKATIDQIAVRRALVDRGLLDAYYESEIESFIAKHRDQIGRCGDPRCKGYVLIDRCASTVECPLCHLLMCRKCEKPDHPSSSCEEAGVSIYNLTGSSTKALRFPRCPECRIPVEKVDGCNFISCRCSANFCYGCESLLNPASYRHTCSPSAPLYQ